MPGLLFTSRINGLSLSLFLAGIKSTPTHVPFTDFAACIESSFSFSVSSYVETFAPKWTFDLKSPFTFSRFMEPRTWLFKIITLTSPSDSKKVCSIKEISSSILNNSWVMLSSAFWDSINNTPTPFVPWVVFKITGNFVFNFSKESIELFSSGIKTVVGVDNPTSDNLSAVLYLSEQTSIHSLEFVQQYPDRSNDETKSFHWSLALTPPRTIINVFSFDISKPLSSSELCIRLFLSSSKLKYAPLIKHI